MTPICIITFYQSESDKREYVLIAEAQEIQQIMNVISKVEFYHLFYYNQIKYETSNCFKMNEEAHILIIRLIKKLVKDRAVRSIEMYGGFDISFPSSFLQENHHNIIK